MTQQLLAFYAQKSILGASIKGRPPPPPPHTKKKKKHIKQTQKNIKGKK
jgi:hypothetical protein